MRKKVRIEEGLTTGDLLRLLQRISGEDADRRGAGQESLLEKGCTWVLVKNRLSLTRQPVPGETLTVETWPLQGRLGLYPRLFEISDEAGRPVAHAEYLWAVMDLQSRSLCSGEERGLRMDGAEEGRLAPARRIAVPEGGAVFALTPTAEQIDENGHMNNCAYADAVEPLLPEALRKLSLCALAVDYEHEILPGRCAEVRVVPLENGCAFEGSMEGKVCFRLREDFAV